MALVHLVVVLVNLKLLQVHPHPLLGGPVVFFTGLLQALLESLAGIVLSPLERQESVPADQQGAAPPPPIPAFRPRPGNGASQRLRDLVAFDDEYSTGDNPLGDVELRHTGPYTGPYTGWCTLGE